MNRIGSVIDYQDPGILSTVQTGYLDDASLLYWLGVTSSPTSAAFTVRTTGGSQRTLSIVAGSSGVWENPALMSEIVPGEAHVPLPLYLHDATAPYWLQVLSSDKAVYLKYNQCVDDSGFQQLAAQALAILKQHPDYRLIVDLRDNVGGENGPFESLINGIKANPSINRSGRIFGLVNQFTDSAATVDAYLLSSGTKALLVGVPPEDPIDEYGNWESLELPQSSIVIQYTTSIVNSTETKMGMPDITVTPTLSQVLAGEDPVLATALGYGD